MDFNDDIVAISTPSGMGAISVIRLTGDGPLKKVEPFFKSKKGTSLSNMKSHTLMYGDHARTMSTAERVHHCHTRSAIAHTLCTVWRSCREPCD